MEVLTEILKFIGMFIGLFALIVCGGVSIVLFFNRLGEINADKEIKKHDQEVRREICRKCGLKCKLKT